MTLSNIDQLSKDDAQRMAPQEVDPVDEEAHHPTAAATPAPEAAAATAVAPPASSDPLKDTTPFGVKPPTAGTAKREAKPDADIALFGTLWPLSSCVKLDPTVDRRVLRQQCQRLDKLGYEFEPLSQEWRQKVAA